MKRCMVWNVLDDFVIFSSHLHQFRSVGAVAQLGERRFCKPEVVGSIPISSTKNKSLVKSGSEEGSLFTNL